MSEPIDDLKLRLERHDYPLSNDLITQGWLWRGSKRLQALALPPAAWVALETALARPGGHHDVLRFDDCCRAGLASGGEVHDHIEWYEAGREAYAALERLRLAAPTSTSEPAAKIVSEIIDDLDGASDRIKLGERAYQRGFDHGRRRAAEDAAEIALALGRPETALSVSVEPVPSTPRVWAMPEIPEDVKAVRNRHGVRLDRVGATTSSGGPIWQDEVGHWVGEQELIAELGPLTEVEETNDGSE